MAGRRVRTLTIVATVAPDGCSWPQFEYDAAHSGTNRFESTLNVGNVGALVQVWSATNGPITSTPVAADGLVYVVAANSIFAYDATGTAGCSGSPKICTPLWTSASRPAFPLDSAGVAVTGGVVYAGTAGGAPGQPVGLAAFDSAGVAGCSGAPEVCAPLWTTSRGAETAPAVANGVIYATDSNGISALDAHGIVNCSGVPKVCLPVWTASGPFAASSPWWSTAAFTSEVPTVCTSSPNPEPKTVSRSVPVRSRPRTACPAMCRRRQDTGGRAWIPMP